MKPGTTHRPSKSISGPSDSEAIKLPETHRLRATGFDGSNVRKSPFVSLTTYRLVDVIEIRNPYDTSLVASVAEPSADEVENAISSAVSVFESSRKLPVHAKTDALLQISRRIEEESEPLAKTITKESGKPIKWARVETQRAASTFRWAAEELRHYGTGAMRLDTEASLGSRLAIVRRFPRGPVLAICPFNFPLNLVAHKVAPALAVGAPIVVKPARNTPLSALRLGELVAETSLKMLWVLPVGNQVAEGMVQDPRFKKVSFTGSSAVGWRLKGLAPRKAFTLELGGNAGAIVCEDADLDLAAARLAYGGYYQAGQSCISVQRILVQEEVYEEFVQRFVKEVSQLKTGDPMDDATDVGPLIDSGALQRVSDWVDEALAQGAQLLCGGRREYSTYQPTVLTRTSPTMKVRCEEVFGPVTTVDTYETFDEALAEVNNSRYGLQACVFTSDINRALLAHREIVAGGVIINDSSAFRAEQMPYGGSKDSGFGREGLRYAMDEMTEPRILVLSDVDL